MSADADTYRDAGSDKAGRAYLTSYAEIGGSMNGCTIYVMKRVDSVGGKAQVTGIDTKYVKEQITVELGADMYLLVSPYKEINKEPLWKRARRKLLIWEANARIWWNREGLGQSDLQTRTPAPVTDAEFHGPLISSSESPQSKQISTDATTNTLDGSQADDIPPNVLCKHGTPLTELCAVCASPDCFWQCEKCDKLRFLGICDDCKHVTPF